MLRPGPKAKADKCADFSTVDASTGLVDYAFYASETGGLLRGKVVNVRAKPQRATPSTPVDQYTNWKPFHHKPNLDSKVQASTANKHDDDTSSDEEDPDATTGNKRKRYASSDDPNTVWSEHAIELLHELFRFDGLGDALSTPCCTTCQVSLAEAKQFLRCQDCYLPLQCSSCCIARHLAAPLHRIQKWNGAHFESITLEALGLIYQLGHGGRPCPSPDPMTRKMTVLDANGIHTISFTYCDCQAPYSPTNIQQLMRAGWYPATTTDPRSCATFNVLDLYRLLNVQANVNANDFVKTLINLTDATHTTKLPDRYVTFARMARQWALLHRIKRSGIGFSLQQLSDIPPGSLAVICWGCPNPDLNLGPDWETKDSDPWYLNMPILALDANFRLKNKLRANERPNPALAPGSAYFVEPSAYKDFLKDYVSEKDISTCIAFAALLEKDTKLTTGLKTSGVGGCACACHEVVRPLGVGDLQKGERYANMDYIFFSAIRNLRLRHIGVSYDIICQWRQNLFTRMLRLPPELHLNPSTTLTFGLPTWHAAAHKLSCRTVNALTYQEGVGRTDGEGIERIWSLLNPASYATKEMSEGVRHDTLDDRLDSHNYQKNITLGSTLSRRLEIALAERDRQIANFVTYDKGLTKERRAGYQQQVDKWKADRSKPCPYMPVSPGNFPTEAEVRAALSADETKEAQAAQAPVHGTSMSAFLVAGFQLEDLQLKLHRDIAGIGHGTPYQQVKIDQHRRTFLDKLEDFRDLQRMYMPGVKRAIQQQPPLPANGDPDAAENIKLWFPSDLPPEDRPRGCSPQLVELEAQFREARCHDALVHLRHYLHAKRHLLGFRNANVTGQNESTKARGLIDSTSDRVEAEAEKYRRSRQALLSLFETKEHEDYPELTKDDITLEVVEDPDILAIVKLGNANSKSHCRPHISVGKKTDSWIWTGLGGPTDEEDIGVGDSVRIEWSKALARKNRWKEEVAHLREEMKRVLRSLDTLTSAWNNAATTFSTTDIGPRHPQAALLHGMQAYALKQSRTFQRIHDAFKVQWGN